MEALYHALKEQLGPPTPSRSLRAELADWIAEAHRSTAKGTWERYAGIAEGFAEHRAAEKHKPLLRDITFEHVRAYLPDVLERKSVSTANQEWLCLRLFWRRDLANGRAVVDRVAPVKASCDSQGKKRRPVTSEEVKLVLTKAEGFW